MMTNKMKGKVKTLNSKCVWVGRRQGSNITRLMTADEALEWSKRTGGTIFCKLKNYELQRL